MRRYLTAQGSDVVGAWLADLRDRRARARIQARLDRLEVGNLGDCKPVGDGAYELRVDYGPGYRVYFARVGRAVILLLCGGDKGSQQADIARAIAHLKDFKEREK